MATGTAALVTTLGRSRAGTSCRRLTAPMAEPRENDPTDNTTLVRLSHALDVAPWIRIVVSALVGVAVGLALTWDSAIAAAMGGWAATGLLSTAWTWFVIVPMDAKATSAHARREEPSRVVAHTVVITRVSSRGSGGSPGAPGSGTR